MSASKVLKLALLGVTGAFIAAALYISTTIGERQDALKQVARYNSSWLASQAVGEYIRLEQRIAAFAVPGSGIDKDEVELRLDIFANRLQLLDDGEFRDFLRDDPERMVLVQGLGVAVDRLEPIVARLESPGAVAEALAVLKPLDTRIVELASAANRYGASRVAQDQQELLRLHWAFSGLAVGLMGCGIVLIGLMVWHNRLLARTHRELQASTDRLRRTSGELAAANGTVTETNAELQSRNRHFTAALTNMSQGLCMVGPDQRVIVCNERFGAMFGLKAGFDAGGMTLEEFFAALAATGQRNPGLLAALSRQHGELARSGGEADFSQTQSDGHTIAVSHRPMPGGGWVATYEDITERRRAEAQIAHMAHHDALTGLANRILFREHLEQALARVQRYGETVGVLCLDLDHFKDVNDTLGHPVGDALLRAVAGRLKSCLRESDVVARLGGDEFAILQPAADHPHDAGLLASRVADLLGRPFDLDGHQVVIGVSLGVAIAPGDGGDPDQILKNADMALYRAKADGRATYRFFEPEMDARLQARRLLELDLRQALAEGQFELHYQPLINLASGTVSGCEALLRWHHPLRGMVSPVDFIPVAEETGLIVALGEWVLRRACADAAGWESHVKVAVNLSPAQFRSRNLVPAVVTAVAAAGIDARRLEVEITESVLLQDNDATLATLHQIRGLGIGIAMDDFGTGYSSLSYLRSFPFDKIKIDQSFVRELTVRADCAAIVHSIAALGANLGMRTTAEGVETEDQLVLLRAAGCTEAQGYYFSQPKPAAEIADFMARMIREADRKADCKAA